MAILERVFDRRSATLHDDLAAFEGEVKAFEQRIAPASTVVQTRRTGHQLRVTILSADVRGSATTSSWIEPWKP